MTDGLPWKPNSSPNKVLFDEERLEAADKRRVLVADYFLQGLSQLEMITRLREDHNIITTQPTISKDLKLLEDSYKVRIAKNYDAERAKDMERIERMIGALWASAATGSINAIKTIVQLLERKAKMLGYDEPIKIDVRRTLIRMAEEAGKDPKYYLAAAGILQDDEDE